MVIHWGGSFGGGYLRFPWALLILKRMLFSFRYRRTVGFHLNSFNDSNQIGWGPWLGWGPRRNLATGGWLRHSFWLCDWPSNVCKCSLETCILSLQLFHQSCFLTFDLNFNEFGAIISKIGSYTFQTSYIRNFCSLWKVSTVSWYYSEGPLFEDGGLDNSWDVFIP